MKPVKIHRDNVNEIESALRAVNGRAESFAVTTFEEVEAVAARAEGRLKSLPKTGRAGTMVVYRPAGPSAGRYKYAATTTTLYLARRAAGWYLTNVAQSTVWPKSAGILRVSITEAQRDEIARRAVADFEILASA